MKLLLLFLAIGSAAPACRENFNTTLGIAGELTSVDYNRQATQATFTSIYINATDIPTSSPTSTVMPTGCGPNNATLSTRYIQVDVGAFADKSGSTFEFRPNHVNANIGDFVLFNMVGLSHSVTQSQFTSPCSGSNAFDTELQPNPHNKSDFIVKPFEVTTAEPLWFFCKQKGPPNHCGQGMVFGINPRSDQQMTEFISRAKTYGAQSANNSYVYSTENSMANMTAGLTAYVSAPTGISSDFLTTSALSTGWNSQGYFSQQASAMLSALATRDSPTPTSFQNITAQSIGTSFRGGSTMAIWGMYITAICLSWD